MNEDKEVKHKEEAANEKAIPMYLTEMRNRKMNQMRIKRNHN